MVELPKTEAELDALITSKVEEATKSLESKHNGAMANLRTTYETKIKSLKEENELGKEEYAKKKLLEQQEADQQELSSLRAFKKGVELEQRLAKEGLPSYFKNDNRLITAEEGDLDKMVKEVKKEYEATLPKGNTHSNVIQQGGSITPNSAKTETEIANEKMGDFLNEILK